MERKTRSQNSSHFAGVNFREFIPKLQEGDEEAWKLMRRHLENYKRHCMFMLYDIYGFSEMRCRDMEPECNAVMDLAAVDAVNNVVFDDELDDKQNQGRIIRFLHIYVKSAFKRFIENQNGVYSKYYAWLYVHMRKNGLDLWKSPDELLCASILECTESCKEPMKVLKKLRSYYADKSESNIVSIDEMREMKHTQPVDVMDDVDFNVTLEQFRKKIGELRYKLFYDYCVDETKYTYKSLSIKYGILPYKVQFLIREAKDAAVKFFNYDGKHEDDELVTRTGLRGTASYTDTHEPLSLEELIENVK